MPDSVIPPQFCQGFLINFARNRRPSSMLPISPLYQQVSLFSREQRDIFEFLQQLMLLQTTSVN